MKYHIERACRMRFDAPAREHHIQVRLAPWDDERQSLARIELTVDPDTTPVAAYDSFGNLAHHFEVLGVHQELGFAMRAEVETRRDSPFDFDPVAPAREMQWIAASLHQAPRLWDFVLHRGELTPELPGEIQGIALPALRDGAPLILQVQDAMRWTSSFLAYDSQGTEPAGSLVLKLETRRGVAEDLAHLLIAVIRRWAVPARFVSGYVDAAYFKQGDVEAAVGPPVAERLHHWAEVLIPGAGWLGFDPALGLLADGTYVRVAVGRDANDIQPLRQSSKGEGSAPQVDEVLSVSRISG